MLRIKAQDAQPGMTIIVWGKYEQTIKAVRPARGEIEISTPVGTFIFAMNEDVKVNCA